MADIIMANLKRYLLPLGIILCGVYLSPLAYDKALTSRHLIWCLTVLVIALCTKEIRVGHVHIFMLGFLMCALFSVVSAVNKSEWLYSVLRIVLMLAYLSVVEIDIKLLSKTMICLGVIFTVYFWYEASRAGFSKCVGLMQQKNYWASAHFFVIPFCYYAISKKFWLFSIAVAASMILNIFLLQSRTAILAVIVSVMIIGVIDKQYRYTIAGVVIAVCGVLYFDMAHILSLQYRFEQWKYTLAMIVDYPLGVGAGNWWIMFPEYAPGINYPGAFIEQSFRFPHNDYLWICAEVGILGLICYVGMIVLSLYYARRKVYLLIGLAGCISISFFTASYERAFASLMLITFVALACKRVPIRQPRILLTLLIFALVVFGFRFNASCWNKKLKKSIGSYEIADNANGYSVFSTLTYNGIPWHWYKGISNFENERYIHAVEQLEIAYRLNPFNIHSLNGMGIASAICGERTEAREYFSKAVRICPEFSEAQENLRSVNE